MSRIKDIIRREQNATPPPWIVHYHGQHGKTHNSYIEATIVREPFKIATIWNKSCLCVQRHQYNNQDFIAHAREDIPYLINIIKEQDRFIDYLMDKFDKGGTRPAFY